MVGVWVVIQSAPPLPPVSSNEMAAILRQFHQQLASAMRTERDRLEQDNEERTRAERERVGQLLETQASKNNRSSWPTLFSPIHVILLLLAGPRCS